MGKKTKLTANQRYEFMCQSIGARPPAHISWWLDERRLETSKETVSFFKCFENIVCVKGKESVPHTPDLIL